MKWGQGRAWGTKRADVFATERRTEDGRLLGVRFDAVKDGVRTLVALTYARRARILMWIDGFKSG